MGETVVLPAWGFAILLVLAAWAAYDRLVMPLLRWMVTHPANRVIDDVSSRLRIGIRPFQRTRRQARRLGLRFVSVSRMAPANRTSAASSMISATHAAATTIAVFTGSE